MRWRGFVQLIAGTAAAAPAAALAQQRRMPVIGFLSSGGRAQGFDKGLSETGYITGQNIEIEYRLAQGNYDQLRAMAADLVGRKVDLIAVLGPPAARAAKVATSTIPIVFISGDPIAEGLVSSLARPGGNLTGVGIITVELMAKRLSLLSELVPQVKVFALMVDPAAPTTAAMIRETEDAARALGVELHILKASNFEPDEIDAAFAALLQLHTGALIVGTDSLNIIRLAYPVAVASRHGIPAMYVSSEFVWSGGLISYGPNQEAAYRQMGIYAGRILKGGKPADLPVQQPTKIELVINLKTAKALGLTAPQTLLAQADDIIE
jgi:putative tryptophan/tyrosine transport system substrate-binding protein